MDVHERLSRSPSFYKQFVNSVSKCVIITDQFNRFTAVRRLRRAVHPFIVQLPIFLPW